jgi:hypothetical protein
VRISIFTSGSPIHCFIKSGHVNARHTTEGGALIVTVLSIRRVIFYQCFVSICDIHARASGHFGGFFPPYTSILGCARRRGITQRIFNLHHNRGPEVFACDVKDFVRESHSIHAHLPGFRLSVYRNAKFRADIQTTMIYAHVVEGSKQQAISRLKNYRENCHEITTATVIELKQRQA